MKGKSKKKKGSGSMKVTIKTEDEQGQVWELQMKKKILQDRLTIQRTRTEEAVRKYAEARTRAFEVRQCEENQKENFSCIEADIEHQLVLLNNNTDQEKKKLDKKIRELQNKKTELTDEKNRLNEEHNKAMNEKNDKIANLKTQMKELSQEFSNQLSTIQKELQDQTRKVSEKWEHKASSHIQTFTTEIEKQIIADPNKIEEKKKENPETIVEENK